MVPRPLKHLGAALLLLLLLTHPADLSSCGPFIPQAVFTRTTGPDDDESFYNGRLGILQGTYARRYLAMAFRILSDHLLTPAQSDEALDFDRFREGPRTDAAVQTWLAARMQLPNAPQSQIQYETRNSYYQTIPICMGDAFLSATKTLNSWIRDKGLNSPEVKDWAAAQDTVFATCAGAAEIPDPPPPGSSARLRADRAYQIAAAYFYSASFHPENFDKALSAFSGIAADASSPWHLLAPYLIARVYLRRDKLPEAQKQLESVLADSVEASIHPSARALLDYVHGRLAPADQLLILSKRLSAPEEPSLGHDLSDYTFLFDRMQRVPDADFAPYQPQKAQQDLKTQSEQLKMVADHSDLTAWIVAFESGGPATVALSEMHWEQSRSVPWLLAALHSATAGDKRAPELIAAARALPSSSPAYAMARFHAARLLIESNRIDEAVAVITEALRTPAVASDLSTQNAFRAEHMKIARTFPEFLAFAPRTLTAESVEGEPTLETDSERKTHPLSMFDTDATSFFNDRLPLTFWLRAAQDRNLASVLRTELVQVGWVRAALTDADAMPFARELRTLKPHYARDLAGYLNATDPVARKFEAAWMMLHHPELTPTLRSGLQRETADGHIDDFRDNWWCAADVPQGHMPLAEFRDTSTILALLYPHGSTPPATFLAKNEEPAAAAEQQKLQDAASAPTYLSKIVVAWAKAHPADSRNAEALALAVRTSHFGCTDSASVTPVREAFDLLHARYPATPWAKRTPYWYQ